VLPVNVLLLMASVPLLNAPIAPPLLSVNELLLTVSDPVPAESITNPLLPVNELFLISTVPLGLGGPIKVSVKKSTPMPSEELELKVSLLIVM